MARAEKEESLFLNKDNGLLFKSITKLNATLHIPNIKSTGSVVSNWELLERVRSILMSENSCQIKIISSSPSSVSLDIEPHTLKSRDEIINKLNGSSIKVSGLPNTIKIAATPFKCKQIKRHHWESHFRDAKYTDETKPGFRPDTVLIQGLPIKWFSKENSMVPSEEFINDSFEVFGKIRRVDIPSLDPYRSRIRHFYLGDENNQPVVKDNHSITPLLFDIYIQYMDYSGFNNCMNNICGKKLIKINNDNMSDLININFNNFSSFYYSVDFDRCYHLSDEAIEWRNKERCRLQEEDQIRAILENKIEEKLEIEIVEKKAIEENHCFMQSNISLDVKNNSICEENIDKPIINLSDKISPTAVSVNNSTIDDNIDRKLLEKIIFLRQTERKIANMLLEHLLKYF